MSQLLLNNFLSNLRKEYKDTYLRNDQKKSELIDTKNVLLYLMHTKEFSKSDYECLHNFEYQINIVGEIVTYYTKKWKPYKTSEALPDEWVEIFTILLYKYFLDIKARGKTDEELLKIINSVFKCLDLASTIWLKKGSELYKSICQDFDRVINNISQQEHSTNNNFYAKFRNFKKPLVVLPVTVLFFEGPIARAYLATIHSMGFTPQKIIHLVFGNDISTKKPIGKLFPEILRKKYLATMHKQRIHYWPNQISKNLPELKKSIFKSVISDFKFSQKVLDQANELKSLTYFCSNIEVLLIKNLRDTLLKDCLQQFPRSTLLYTGGGIVPKDLLDISNIKFIHIHPGFLPSLRGADCFLWSVLLHGRASASCFYMNDGIDTGNIILAAWLPRISFEISRNEFDLMTLYRSIYSYLDPWVRSFVLRQVIERYSDSNFYSISASTQLNNDGILLNFMHNKIKDVVMDELFPFKY